MNHLSREDIDEILRLVDNSGYGELRLELNDLKIHVRRQAVAAPVNGSSSQAEVASVPAAPSQGSGSAAPAPAPALAPPAAPAPENAEGTFAVRAPMLGSFYRSPAPDKPPFVQVGDRVEPGQDVGLIEVMKLFNSVKADVVGEVVEVRAENGAMVEYDEVLMVIREERP